MDERRPLLCQNCLATELTCQMRREMDRAKCCGWCEHVGLDAADRER